MTREDKINHAIKAFSEHIAELREALERARNTLLGVRDLTDNPDIREGVANCLAEWVEPALAATPRNCDVGTAEEQTRRMDAEYCYVQKSCYESPSGRECPLHKAGVDCRLIWAQMTYEKGGER